MPKKRPGRTPTKVRSTSPANVLTVRDTRRVLGSDKDWQTEWHPKDMEKVEGLLWPPIALKYRDRYIRHAPDMEKALQYAPKRRVAFQAGGNVGTWAIYLASRFEQVYTVEPDAMNFYCLARNAWMPNVYKAQAALGEGGSPIAMNFHRNNIGAHNVIGAGNIPQLKIDDFNLPVLDFMCLDIEGYEVPALKGAPETLDRCKPVLQLEDRGHNEKYGNGSFSELVEWLASEFGYREADRVAKDRIFAA